MNTYPLEQGRIEYDAWQLVVAQAREHGIDFNRDVRLHAAITAWAEELAQLRGMQTPGVKSRAHREAIDRFDCVFCEPAVADAFTPPDPFSRKV